ncbi:small integral membrane protein 27 [Elgaria multicarinata webbii]|uniref:small integral membrane protein 27 n=1 Tax=Elgaria multicarinata webbii TaxID=159646 RepID=UPI002FCCC617
MAHVSRRTLEWIYSLILLTIVLLSWGYVIYATRIAAKWQLKEDYPTETQNL